MRIVIKQLGNFFMISTAVFYKDSSPETSRTIIFHSDNVDDAMFDGMFDSFKGLGHAILGNFSTDQMVIKLTKISK